MINAMQKGGNAVFSIDEVMTMAEESTKIFKKLKAVVDEATDGFEKSNKKSKKAKEQ